MNVQVKICGLTTPSDLALCHQLGVAWVGLVFHPPSPRALNAGRAAVISAAAPPASQGGPKRVGLFVKPTLATIQAVLDHVQLDVLQLYTSLEQAAMLQQALGREGLGGEVRREVWLSRAIKSKADVPSAMAKGVARWVVEAKPANQAMPGGAGQRFDWGLLSDWRQGGAPGPWMLAGGLNPSNVGRAIAATGAVAVDVSSGVESAPGVKSPALIKAFVEQARQPSTPLGAR
ncbi:phosphoribosylanthranilate isomerase [Formicincola oecophyllae]|uniref:N-(5'-phosphoribosyl)anthranilate isomerase n=1 Tax=Formicincola oecophyllae TaxID=2558361 RepID=A0A4Y6UBJ4_9PROT|nr:phosphoribosylanthranilate isomerase [Formicincola oecophyllae]